MRRRPSEGAAKRPGARKKNRFAGDLRARGVMVDTRGDILRFGPAPYLSDVQLRDAMGALGEIAR